MSISKAIDPARVGLSKSLMTSPCERKGFFGETVRDSSGRRLHFPMPERVLFGRAVDEAIGFIVWAEREGRSWSREMAVAHGMTAARSDEASWAILDDPRTFDTQVANAIALYTDPSQPDGLARLRPYIPGIRIQGEDGRSLGHEGLIGTPDFIAADGTVIDIKTAARTYSPSKFVTSAEMPVYALLVVGDLGYLPPRLVYQVYVRVTRPYWQWIETVCTADHVELGREHAARWRYGFSRGDLEAFSFDPTFCPDCPFAAPLPDVAFTGCRVGMAVKAIGEDVSA